MESELIALASEQGGGVVFWVIGYFIGRHAKLINLNAEQIKSIFEKLKKSEVKNNAT